MKRIFLPLLAVVLIASLLLSGCGAPQTTPEAPAGTTPVPATEAPVVERTVEVPAQRTEVRLSGWAATPQETALLEALLYQFSVENPDIVVKYEPITGDYWQSTKTSVAAGTEPDIYYMDIFQFPFFAQQGVLMPLDDLMAGTDTSKEAFIPTLMDAFVYDGKVYGIPKDFNTLGLFYNKEMFAAANLAEPTDDWTWDDLQKAAQALSNDEKKIYGMGVPADAGRFPIFAFQNGGQIMNGDFSDTLLDSPETIAAARFYTGFRKDKIGAIPSDVGESWQGTAFGKGTVGMVLEGGWLIPYLKEQFPGIQYGVVTPPAGPQGEGNLIFTVAYVMSANTKNSEAAWKVINYLTNESSQTRILESGFALPSRTSLENNPYFETNPASATIFRGAQNGTPYVWGLFGSDVNDQVGKALERIYLQDQDVEASLNEAATKLREIFKN